MIVEQRIIIEQLKNELLVHATWIDLKNVLSQRTLHKVVNNMNSQLQSFITGKTNLWCKKIIRNMVASGGMEVKIKWHQIGEDFLEPWKYSISL